MNNEPTPWIAGGPGTIWPSSDKDCHVCRVVPTNVGRPLEYIMDWPYNPDKVKYFTKEKAETKAKSLNK